MDIKHLEDMNLNTLMFFLFLNKRIADERMEKRFEPIIKNLRLELKRIKNF